MRTGVPKRTSGREMQPTEVSKKVEISCMERKVNNRYTYFEEFLSMTFLSDAKG